MEKDESVDERRSRAASGGGPAVPGRPFCAEPARRKGAGPHHARPNRKKAEVLSFPSEQTLRLPPRNAKREERHILTRKGSVQSGTILNMPDAGSEERDTNKSFQHSSQ